MLILTFRRSERAFINEHTILTFAEKDYQHNARITIKGPQLDYNQWLSIGDTLTLETLPLTIVLLERNSRHQIRIGFDAPDNIIILREKVYLRNRQKRLAA